MRLDAFVLVIIFSAIWFGCTDPTKNEKDAHHTEHSDWDYSGETGPEHWAELEVGADCGGLHQSPVNIIHINTEPGDIVSGLVPVHYNKIDTIRSISNNGHTIQYNFVDANNIIGYKDKKYKMIQFHFHSPSEHTVNGVRYPLEIHAVHQCEELNSFIVVAALVQQGEPDSTFTFLEKYLPIKTGETKVVNATYSFGGSLRELFGLDVIDVYTYNGSLTTPPCTENVLWIVLKNVNTASAEQIELLQRLMPINNYREVQPLNGRTIYRETVYDIIN